MLLYWIKPLGQRDYTQTDRKGFLRFLAKTCKVGSHTANNILQKMENEPDGDTLEIESPYYKGLFLRGKVFDLSYKKA